MSNMKEVLKKTRKGKSRKMRTSQSSRTSEPVNDEAISEIMIKNWKFSSPPNLQKSSSDSPPVNAFERLMSKKPEQLGEQPAVNGGKKRKYLKKPKFNKLEDNHDDQSLLDESITAHENAEPQISDQLVADEMGTKKRGRTDEVAPEAINGNPKTRRSKKAKLILNSNENSFEENAKSRHCDDSQVEAPKYFSGRPRRSCAENVNYELLISPDKTTKAATTPPKKVRRANKKDDDSFEIHDVDDDSTDLRPTRKLAPLFVKKIPKPAVDPAVKEARRTFLLSGLPDEMRSSIDKLKQYENDILSNELVSFPSISHVTQLKLNVEDHSITQDLTTSPLVTVRSDDEIEIEVTPEKLNYGMLTECLDSEILDSESCRIEPVWRDQLQNDYLKTRVKELKEIFGNFPTNRCFKQLYWMFQNAGASKSESEHYSDSEGASKTEDSMFVNIFKPTKIEHFVVNAEPMKELQKFLLTWNDKSSDFDSDDSSSRTSTRGSNSFVVLSGPNGSGKTISVYALANDLNYQVIEINAGARRSGKRLLESLLEATQSHRVRDKSGKLFSTEEESSVGETICDVAGAKSIILIEDAELAFESDDGFVSSIQQLINISKRPV